MDRELYFLLDSDGALIVFQEKGASWSGVLAFSSEAKAREFCARSNVDAAEIAAISTADSDAVASIVKSLKPRAVRNLLLDLDFKTGICTQVEFVGETLGPESERRFNPADYLH